MPTDRLVEPTSFPFFSVQSYTNGASSPEDKLPLLYDVNCMEQHTLLYAATKKMHRALRAESKEVTSMNVAGLMMTVVYVEELIESGQLGDHVSFKDFYLPEQAGDQALCSTQDFFESPVKKPIKTKSKKTINMTQDHDFNRFLYNNARLLSSYAHTRWYQSIKPVNKSIEGLQSLIESPLYPRFLHHTETSGLYQFQKERVLSGIVKDLQDKSTILGVIINCHTDRCICTYCQVAMLAAHFSHEAGLLSNLTVAVESAREKELNIPVNGLYLQSFITANRSGKGTANDYKLISSSTGAANPLIRLTNLPKTQLSEANQPIAPIIQGHTGVLGIQERVATSPQREESRRKAQEVEKGLLPEPPMFLSLCSPSIENPFPLRSAGVIKEYGQRMLGQGVHVDQFGGEGLTSFLSPSKRLAQASSTSSEFSDYHDKNEPAFSQKEQNPRVSRVFDSPQKRSREEAITELSSEHITPSKGNLRGPLLCSKHNVLRPTAESIQGNRK